MELLGFERVLPPRFFAFAYETFLVPSELSNK
jgi:hypothetical protein